MAKRMRFILSTIMVIVAMTAKAQVTTSSLSGKVTDPDKEAIIGATVQAIHEPSGTRYGAITNIDGRYTIQGMRACWQSVYWKCWLLLRSFRKQI